MNTSPYLRGAIAAQAHMEDVRRDAERRRLVKSVALETRRGARRNWLERLGRRLKRHTAAYAEPAGGNTRYSTAPAASNAKV